MDEKVGKKVRILLHLSINCDCHEPIFMKFTLPKQLFVRKLYSKFRENTTQRLVAVSR